jgi:copper(I)-binding protein
VIRAFAFAIAACALALTSHASAAPQIQNAWMRPALAGASADAYADVVTERPLTLARVRTPVAREVEIVLLDPRDPGATPKVVDRLDLKAGETRFALKGSVLRLVDLRSTVTTERPVPLAFEFVDDAGVKSVVEVLVQVRGLLPPKPAN